MVIIVSNFVKNSLIQKYFSNNRTRRDDYSAQLMYRKGLVLITSNDPSYRLLLYIETFCEPRICSKIIFGWAFFETQKCKKWLSGMPLPNSPCLNVICRPACFLTTYTYVCHTVFSIMSLITSALEWMHKTETTLWSVACLVHMMLDFYRGQEMSRESSFYGQMVSVLAIHNSSQPLHYSSSTPKEDLYLCSSYHADTAALECRTLSVQVS